MRDEPLSMERLLELAQRAAKRDIRVFTPFLTPPEQQLAAAAARKAGVSALADGGLAQAERRMICFTSEEAVALSEYPMRAVSIQWTARAELTHRDVLGSVMGLGLERRRLGDIAVEGDHACVMAEAAVAAILIEQLSTVGRYGVTVARMDAPPAAAPDEGDTVTGTVSSNRLDAVLGLGYHMSRSQAAELIASGAVKLRYAPCIRPDAHVEPDDVISVRGKGRLILRELRNPTKKDRLPITLLRLGDKK